MQFVYVTLICNWGSVCERLGMRKEGLFLEFISFINNPNGKPRYENTYHYAILKKEWGVLTAKEKTKQKNLPQ